MYLSKIQTFWEPHKYFKKSPNIFESPKLGIFFEIQWPSQSAWTLFISRPLVDVVKTTRIYSNLFVFLAKNAGQDMVGTYYLRGVE